MATRWRAPAEHDQSGPDAATTPAAGGDATTLRRGIAVLGALGAEAGGAGLGVGALAVTIGEDKSQVSRTLKVLAGAGLVERVPGGRAYRLGWGLFALAASAGDARLRQEAPPLLAALTREVGERAHLSVLQGGEVLTVASEAPRSALQAGTWVGTAVPAHCSSAGRALLIDHDRAALAGLFGEGPLPPGGPDAPRDLEDLVARVAGAARVGYALVEEEFEAGLVGIAAPVRDFTARVVAAINVSGPTFRLGGRTRPVAVATRAAADHLSGLLGARPPVTPGASMEAP